MWRTLIIGLSFILAGCFTQPVREGDGTVSTAARDRLAAEKEEAFYAQVRATAEYAAAHPDDLRANRKAVALATDAVRRIDRGDDDADHPSIPEVLQWTEGARGNLSRAPSRCATNVEVAKLHRFAGDHAAAMTLLHDSVSQCGYIPAMKDLAYAFERARRCDEIVPLASNVWTSAKGDEQIPVLDAVRICSTSVNLRSNLLQFAPPQIVDDYFALLAARARQRRQSNCESRCWSAYDSCVASCRYGSCGCGETRDLCSAMCQ